MGQQQLLLIILITILVGIATIVAVNTMQGSYESANYDAIQQDILQAQSASLAFKRKPATLGGGDGSYTGITLSDISLKESNDNATYEITEVNPGSFVIVASSVMGEFTVTATITDETVNWVKQVNDD